MRVHPAFLYAGHPLASVGGPFNAITVESDAITEITMSGPGAGGLQTASAVLGDVIASSPRPHRPPRPLEPLALVIATSPRSFYLHMEVADRPGVLAAVAQVLGEHGASIKSVVQRGLGETPHAWCMVSRARSLRVASAGRAIARDRRRFDFLRSAPRAVSGDRRGQLDFAD